MDKKVTNQRTERKEKKHKMKLKKYQRKAELKDAKSFASKKLSYSKMAFGLILFLVFEVIAFAQLEMHILGDLDSLPVLIGGTVTAGVAAIIQYFYKSMKENTKGGIIYNMADKENLHSDNIPEGDIDLPLADEESDEDTENSLEP